MDTNENQNLHDHALAFIRSSQLQAATPLHNLMIDRCVAHLQTLADISSASAERIAAHALGEYESLLHRHYIDLDTSTSHAVFVRDPGSNRTFVFSAACLARVAQLVRPETHHPPSPARHALWVGIDPCAADSPA